MKPIVCKDYRELSYKAADLVAAVMYRRPAAVLGLATGSTPIGLYDRLVTMYESGDLDFARVTTVNLDEYCPISPENVQSYRYFMNVHLFNRVNISPRNTHIPDGLASHPEQEAEAYEALLQRIGPPDIQILGIGQNGHIGFNEPDTKLNPKTHLTKLTESTILANSRFFASRDEVPTGALTMGIGTILRARRILLLASGAGKHDAVMTMLAGMLTTECPASFLNLHHDVTVICDEAAYFG